MGIEFLVQMVHMVIFGFIVFRIYFNDIIYKILENFYFSNSTLHTVQCVHLRKIVASQKVEFNRGAPHTSPHFRTLHFMTQFPNNNATDRY